MRVRHVREHAAWTLEDVVLDDGPSVEQDVVLTLIPLKMTTSPAYVDVLAEHTVPPDTRTSMDVAECLTVVPAPISAETST